MRRFIISDIHGCHTTFLHALAAINLTQKDQLFILGDMIDRGKGSKGVIDTILSLQQQGYQIQCLRGNHEQIFLDLYDNPQSPEYHKWLQYGGKEMLESFGVSHPREVPELYISFMRSLPFYIISQNTILVHGGINFHHQPNPLNDSHALMWQRYWYESIDREWLGDRNIIHGHTPTSKSEIKTLWQHFKEQKYLNVDAGCWYIDKEGQGYLCVVELEEEKIYFYPNVERDA